jgi:hypothetical protein
MARAAAKSAGGHPYSVHPSVAMVQKWVDALPAKTGRSLAEWVKLMKKEGPATEEERREWLKCVHGFGTNNAWWLAEYAANKATWDGDPDSYLRLAPKYVEDMFAGKKAGLRPIYDALLKMGLALGKDVKACPCKTIVPLYRNHVFAEIKPTTQTRIDMGYSLTHYKGKLPTRLIDTGGAAKKDRITHRIAITSVDEVDDEVERWIRAAYELDA